MNVLPNAEIVRQELCMYLATINKMIIPWLSVFSWGDRKFIGNGWPEGLNPRIDLLITRIILNRSLQASNLNRSKASAKTWNRSNN